MTVDSCNSVVSKDHQTRLAFRDMTNLPSKRGISSILGDLLLKSGGDDSTNIAPSREGGSGVKFSKRLCLVVDDLVKESTRTSDDENNSSGSGSEDKNNSSGDGDNSENFDLVDVKESQGETNAGEVIVQELKCEKDLDMTVFSSQTDDVITTTTGEDVAMTVFCNSESDDNKLAVAEIKNQDIKSFDIKRCSNLDGLGIVNHHQDLEADDDELNSCSCSFCLKAAYIWSDLHYQDIKGRLSVLKKSQKEASNLIQRNGKSGKQTDNNSSANEDFDIMGQWTTLFLSMQGILATESNHLQNSFVTMKELRENCKIDLEKSTKTPQHNKNTNNT